MSFDDGAQVAGRLVELVIDDEVFIHLALPYFIPGLLEALSDHVGAIFGSIHQSSAQFVRRWRQQEDEQSVLKLLIHLLPTLHIDIEEDVYALIKLGLDGGNCRPISIAEYLGPLDELAGFGHTVELSRIDEVVVAAMYLLSPQGPGRVRDASSCVGQRFKKSLAQRGLSGPGGRRNNDGYTGSLIHNYCLSFKILDLLAETLKLSLKIYDQVRELCISGLRPDRIHLSVHLLEQEVELAPHRLV